MEHSAPSAVRPEPDSLLVDIAEYVSRGWSAILDEYFGIPVWLWLLMAVGLLVPVCMVGSLLVRR